MSNLLGPHDIDSAPVPTMVDGSIVNIGTSLLKNIKRSAYIYRVNCGDCDGYKIGIFATLSPLLDIERFDIKVVPSSHHADILLFTDAVTHAVRSLMLRAQRSVPDPKVYIPYGACGDSNGTFHDLCCVWGGMDKVVSVDVYIPGCPPTSATTLYGFAIALSLLEQETHARAPGEPGGQPAEVLYPNTIQPLRVEADREVRHLARYRYDCQIADGHTTQLGQGGHWAVRWLEVENDPRSAEIVMHLNHVIEGARIR